MTADIHALAGAYSVDALNGAEKEMFEEHLVACEACALQVAELQATAARLGSAAEEPPPPNLRPRVLAAINRTRQVPPPITAPAPRGPSLRSRLALPGIAAAVALLMGLGFVAGRLTGGDPAREELAAVLAAPDTMMVPMTAPTGASARFVYAQSLGIGVLVATGLEPAAAGSTYQLWLIDEEGPKPAGLFVPGPGVTTAVAEGGVNAVQAVGVTLEPEGGSPQPTGEILLLGEL